MTRRLRARWFEGLALAVGLLILGGTLWRIGVQGLARDLGAIGWGLGAILLVEVLNVLLNTWGWSLGFPAGERRVSARRLLAIRMAGDGVNYLTPSATVGGELLRVRLLGADAPLALRWASVSAAKLGQTVGQAIFILLGLTLVLPRLVGAAPWVGWLGGTIAAILVALAFVWLIHRGLWASLRGVARRLGVRQFLPSAWAEHGRDLDAALRRLGGIRVVAGLACFVAAWSVGAVEIYLILLLAGARLDWHTCLALEAGSALIDGILFFVPAKVGTQEGGKVVLFAALGLDPARGLTVGVVRRIRELIYAGLGLAALGWLTARPASSSSSSSRTAAEAVVGGRSRHHV